MFLYEKLEDIRESGFYSEIPDFILKNINQNFSLRDYQIKAIENFISYFENKNLVMKPTQNLFHMATGSGKTLVMACLILYLYEKGYNNFIFFVNSENIIAKTEENFLNTFSKKYLFNKNISINNKLVNIKKIESVEDANSDSINIRFSTVQKLHTELSFGSTKENALSFCDFNEKRIVLIADEAHHLNSATKKKKQSKNEEELEKSWEYTVTQLFYTNNDNILLEFTATADLEDDEIKNKYENLLIYDYPLVKFREDLYSKEIKTIRSDVSVLDRVMQAFLLSQYRLKVFEENSIFAKPVVLLKGQKIAENKEFQESLVEYLNSLDGAEIERIMNLTANETLKTAYKYFLEEKSLTYDLIATEIKEDFSPPHMINANDDKAKLEDFNTLEERKNPYRVIFAVDKLNEGWDVLNLFDIVRLYETRTQSKTIQEAQLIGRGARYFPFSVNEDDDKYKRKYDNDYGNKNHILEELHYHCENDSKYISELNKAMRELGLGEVDDTKECVYRLKESFKNDRLYKEGLLFLNEKVRVDRENINSLLPSLRDKVYSYNAYTGDSGEEALLDSNMMNLNERKTEGQKTCFLTIKEIAEDNFSLIYKALNKFEIFSFSSLLRYYPNLKSRQEFIESKNYLGDIKLEINYLDTLTQKDKYNAVLHALAEIEKSISTINCDFEGSKKFYAKNIKDCIKDKTIQTKEIEGSKGYSQNDYSVEQAYRLDLEKEDWYAFNDNYGTSEEKAFVAYFKKYVEKLKEKYQKVYLVRNEREVAIFSFEGAERFEPDFILFLQRKSDKNFEQLQVFIEPKGSHLLEKDKWKEDFLLKLEDEKDGAIAVKIFADDNDYKITGLHFFNTVNSNRRVEFDKDMKKLIEA